MIGLDLIFDILNFEYKYGFINDIENYDIIYSPNNPINANLYCNKKFIFGPHFSVFLDRKILSINNIHKKSVYIQPSNWARDVWINKDANNFLPIKTFPFPVDIEKFKSLDICNKENEVFIYFKRRKPDELQFIQNFLDQKNIKYKIFDYIKRYNEDDYLNTLQRAKYGIILDAHESQGFAIEEALSSNVPLLVWNVRFMSQEYGSRYENIPATTIPYWDERCGEYFYQQNEFEETYNKFISKIETYKPREYIIENLSPKKCAENFLELINSF